MEPRNTLGLLFEGQGKSDTTSSDAKSDSEVSSSSNKATPKASKSTQHLQPVATGGNDQHKATAGFQPSSAPWRLRPKNQLDENFTNICHLDEGGFARVFKVTHKHDGCEYALKVLKLRPDLERKILREVRILAQLNHPNVVRYHTSWLDPADFTNPAVYGGSSSSTSDYGDTSSSKPSPAFQKESTDFLISFNQSAEPGCRDEGSRGFSSSVSPSSEEQVVKTTDQYLHIKMELCHLALKKWLATRNSELGDSRGNVPVEDCDNILEQLLKGVDYIHDQGVIHRDLKPANIFLVKSASSPAPIVKIGDFGLARELLDTPCGSPTGLHPGSGDHNQVQLTAEIGTQAYASPEQRAGSHYTNKTDMYSVALIMFELYHPFGETEMERRDSLLKVRRRDCDDLLEHLPPKQRRYVRELTSEVPESRPTAKEMLKELFPDKDQLISKLQRKIQELENMSPGVLTASTVSQCDSCDEEPADSDTADKDRTIALLRGKIRHLEINQEKPTEAKRSTSDRRKSKSF